MLIPTSQIKSSGSHSSRATTQIVPPVLNDLNHPAHDRDSRRAFENLLASEITRRFGDRRSIFERTTREWALLVVRKRYWFICAYLLVATLVWLAVVVAGIIAVFAVLDPRRTGASFLLISFLVGVAVAPLLEGIERRVCSNWVLGLKDRRSYSKLERVSSTVSQVHDRAA